MICGEGYVALDLRVILLRLAEFDVRFVIIGGVALQLQGSSYTTFDLDLAYERTRENCARLVSALDPFSPRPRGWSADLPFVFDAQTLLTNDLLTLETMAGDVDLLGAVKGIGAFDRVFMLSEIVDFEGVEFRVLSVEGLIMAKTAAGRPKDAVGLIELEALREARQIAVEHAADREQ